MLLREYAYCLLAEHGRHTCVVSSTLFCFNVIKLRCTFRSAIVLHGSYISQEVCRLSKVKAQQLHYWQSDDVAEGCGRYGSALCFLIAVAIAAEREWRDASTWRAPPNHTPVRWTRIRFFTPHAYESIPKKKKNCFCHTTRKKVGEPSDANVPPSFLDTFADDHHGVFQVEGCCSGAFRSGVFTITCGSGWTRAYGETCLRAGGGEQEPCLCCK